MTKTGGIFRIAAWAVAAVVVGALGAEPGSTNLSRFTTEAIVAEVLERNPELEFYRLEIAAARGDRKAAATLPNPEISSSLGPKHVRTGGLSDEGIAWSVAVQQTFEWPGRIPLRKAIANGQVKMAELGLAQFRAALAARASALAYSLFAAREKAEAAQEVSARFAELRGALAQREPAGLTPELELRIIEATELIAQRQATDASLALRSAILDLNQLRGAPWVEVLTVLPPKLSFAEPPDDPSLISAAKTNNFELQMRRLELDQRGLKLSLARNERYPSFTVGPYYSQERAGDREHQFGIGLSLPIPIRGNKGNIAAAEAREKQAETALFVAERDLERRVLDRAAIYRAKLGEIARWRAEAVDEFRKAAALADRHYRLGAVPITVYVELQKQYLEALESLLNTRLEALDSAQQLRLLTGLDLQSTNQSESQSTQR